MEGNRKVSIQSHQQQVKRSTTVPQPRSLQIPQPQPQQRMHINEIALSQSNINELAGVCERFVRDKYGVDLTTETLRIILPRIVSQILNQFQNSESVPAVHEINKIAMMRIKEFVLEQKMTRLQEQQERDQHQQIRMERQVQLQQAEAQQDIVIPFTNTTGIDNRVDNRVENVNNPQINADNHDDRDDQDDEVPEQTFMEKLKILEMQRTHGLQVAGAENPVSSTSQNQKNTFVTGKSMQQQPQPTIIYVPSQAPTSTSWKSRTIVINGVDRQWDYFHERSSIMWPGPLSTVSTVKLSCMLLPTFTSSITPIIFMKIVGAGQNSEEVAFVLKESSGGCWDTWMPLTDSIQALACPWTITLFNYQRKPLEMGNDAQSIKVATLLLDGNTKIQFSSKMDRVKKGDVISLKNTTQTDSELDSTVLNVVDDYVVLDGNHSQHIGYIACNTHLQVHIIIEVIT